MEMLNKFSDNRGAMIEKNSSFFAEANTAYRVTDPAIVSLPADADNGVNIKIRCATAASISIVADIADIIRLGITDTSFGGSVTNTNVGNCITIQYSKDENCWYCDSVQGKWSVQNGLTTSITDSTDNVQAV